MNPSWALGLITADYTAYYTRRRTEQNRGRRARQAACEWLNKGAPGVDDPSVGLRGIPSPALEESPRGDQASESSAAEPAPLVDLDDERAAPAVGGQSCGDALEDERAAPAAFPPVEPPMPLSPQPHPGDAVDLLLKQQ